MTINDFLNSLTTFSFLNYHFNSSSTLVVEIVPQIEYEPDFIDWFHYLEYLAYRHKINWYESYIDENGIQRNFFYYILTFKGFQVVFPYEIIKEFVEKYFIRT